MPARRSLLAIPCIHKRIAKCKRVVKAPTSPQPPAVALPSPEVLRAKAREMLCEALVGEDYLPVGAQDPEDLATQIEEQLFGVHTNTGPKLGVASCQPPLYLPTYPISVPSRSAHPCVQSEGREEPCAAREGPDWCHLGGEVCNHDH